MPRHNRVTPFGEIVANPARGTLMGNRGCLHDDAGQIVRRPPIKAWISCLTVWPGIRRQLMAPRQYTELFFLDEATALAAGHRPCGSCRHAALKQFKIAWAEALGLAASPSVSEIDARLAQERGKANLAPIPERLPDGAMVTVAGTGMSWLRRDGGWWLWSFEGYAPSARLPEGSVELLTPPSIVAVLERGYCPF